MSPKRKKTTPRPPRTPTSLRDPAPVAEVRAARRKLVAEAGGTVQGLVRFVFRDRGTAPRSKRRRSA